MHFQMNYNWLKLKLMPGHWIRTRINNFRTKTTLVLMGHIRATEDRNFRIRHVSNGYWQFDGFYDQELRRRRRRRSRKTKGKSEENSILSTIRLSRIQYCVCTWCHIKYSSVIVVYRGMHSVCIAYEISDGIFVFSWRCFTTTCIFLIYIMFYYVCISVLV